MILLATKESLKRRVEPAQNRRTHCSEQAVRKEPSKQLVGVAYSFRDLIPLTLGKELQDLELCFCLVLVQ